MSVEKQAQDLLSVEQRIREYLTENFLLGEKFSVDPTASLLGEGVLDSTGVLELITFLEQEFDVRVADAEIVPENLDSLANLAVFVQRKHAVSPPEAPRAQAATPS